MPNKHSSTPSPPTAIQALADMPVSKILALVIPILLFGGCCFTLMVGIVASQYDEVATKDETVTAKEETSSDPVLVEQQKEASPVVHKEPVESSQVTKMRVIVFDDTEQRPIPKKAEIWFRGTGSWWLARDTGPKTLGPRPVDQLLEGDGTLVVYPSGRGLNDEGQRIDVPLKLTPEMNPEGSSRDADTIEVSDSSIKVWGLPVKAALGTTEIVFPRK